MSRDRRGRSVEHCRVRVGRVPPNRNVLGFFPSRVPLVCLDQENETKGWWVRAGAIQEQEHERMVLVSWHPCKLLTASNYVPRALQVLVRACARFARPRIFVNEEYYTVHTCAPRERRPVHLAYKSTFSANEQYFSLVTNQPTILSAMTYQQANQTRVRRWRGREGIV